MFNNINLDLIDKKLKRVFDQFKVKETKANLNLPTWPIMIKTNQKSNDYKPYTKILKDSN